MYMEDFTSGSSFCSQMTENHWCYISDGDGDVGDGDDGV